MEDDNILETGAIPIRDKAEYIFKIIGRFDSYINSTNAKASLILAWNGLVLGFVLLKYDGILSNFDETRLGLVIALCLVGLLGISSVISSGFAFRFVFPYLKESQMTGRPNDKSIVFFGSVASMTAEEYLSKIENLTSDELLLDLSFQATSIAYGLNNKMKQIQRSIYVICGQLVFFSGLFVLKVLVG